MTDRQTDRQIGRQTNIQTGRQTDRRTNYQVVTNKLVLCSLLAAFSATVKEHGRLDIVVNNAAIMDENDWDKTLDVNLVSTCLPLFMFLKSSKKLFLIICTSYSNFLESFS